MSERRRRRFWKRGTFTIRQRMIFWIVCVVLALILHDEAFVFVAAIDVVTMTVTRNSLP